MISRTRATNFLLTLIIAFSLGAMAIAQQFELQSQVVDSNGNVVATASTRFTVAATQANSPGQTTPATTLPTTLPGTQAQTYESDRWIASQKFDDHGLLIPAITEDNLAWAAIISLSSTPG